KNTAIWGSMAAMNKRTFLKLASAAAGSCFISPLMAWATAEKIMNLAGNIEYSTESVSAASSFEQVRDFVQKHGKLNGLGPRHCFNTIADTKDHLLSVKSLDEMISIDAGAQTVTLDAGMTYGKLSLLLHSKGFALHNLPSLPHFSVAGACPTATHGS